MKNLLPFLFLSTVCSFTVVPAHADSITILSTSGTLTGGPPVSGSQSNIAQSQYVGMAFVLGGTYTDVSITVPDFTFVNWAATAWLTNAIGPGTTSANVIATATTDVTNGQLLTTTFLSGLTLYPGTYFFFLSSPFCSSSDISPGCGFGLWNMFSDATVVAAPDAAYFGQEIVGGFDIAGQCIAPNCPNFAFPPASGWDFSAGLGFPNTGPLAIDITGRPVPEPSTLLLLGTILLVLGLRLRRALH